MQLESDRRYRFTADPETVWDALRAVKDYQSWWPWLDEFETETDTITDTITDTERTLAPGTTWRCAVRSPIQIGLRFTITLDVVTDPGHIAATLAGDLVGPASLTIAKLAAGGSEIRLTSRLAPRSTTLGLMMRIAPPLAKWAHDHLLDTAARQFEQAVADH